MKNLFNSIKLSKPKSNVFDLTHDVKLSLDMGNLVPIMCMECVPGDKVHLSCESLLRFAPLVSPVMHRMDVTIHYFAVPYRLLWDNWENFITQTKVGGAVPGFPYIQVGNSNYAIGSLMDYLGIPYNDGRVVEENVNAMPFAAYQLIYDEYYRDQNLVTSQFIKLADGFNNTGAGQAYEWLRTLRRRAWEHDYFTAALPFAQKGDAVEIPLGTVALDPDQEGVSNPIWVKSDDYGTVGDPGALQGLSAGMTPGQLLDQGSEAVTYDPDGSLTVEPTTINDLRRAFRLQEWLEKNARGGTRYIEHILSHFGVRSSDKRLQRPEYITGTKSPVQISEILNTTGTTELPQGNMAGHGVSVTTGKYGKYFCEEHCFVMGIMSVMPRTAYQDGMPKMFLKTTDAFQYYQPSFANIGEQEVLRKEVYAYHAQGDETFGYVPRYAEYKYMPSRVAGDFRTTLDFWHLGRIFAAMPSLNQEFIECNPDTRIFAVEGEDQKLYAHVLNKVKAIRPMPKYGTPTF